MYRLIVKHIMENKTFYYVDDESIQILELVKIEGKFYFDEDKEIEITLIFNEDYSLYASWWESCDEYTSVEVFVNREDAVASLKEDLTKRIAFLQQKLAALE